MVTIEASVRKTGRVLIVEEDHLTGGWGAEVAAKIANAAFSYLRAPIRQSRGTRHADTLRTNLGTGVGT